MYPNQPCQPCTDCESEEPVTPPTPPPACVGEPCVEIVSANCVRYTGPAIPCLDIVTNENINSIIQKIAAKLCECCPDTEAPATCNNASGLTATPQ